MPVAARCDRQDLHAEEADRLDRCLRTLTEADVDWQIQAYGHTGHAFTAENIPLDATRTFGFQPDTYRRSWKAMKDFLAEVLS